MVLCVELGVALDEGVGLCEALRVALCVALDVALCVALGEGVALGVSLHVLDCEGVALGVPLALAVALPSHAPTMATLSSLSVLPVKFKGVMAQQKPAGLRSAAEGKSTAWREKALGCSRRLLLPPQCAKRRVALGTPAASPHTLPLP